MGHATVVANNGREALDLLSRQRFDLVLMDIQMPEMDGIAATARIREGEISTQSHIPIIAMTAHTMKGDRERCSCRGHGWLRLQADSNAEALEDASASLMHLPTGGEGQENAEPKPVEGVTGWNRRETLEGLGGDENLLREVTEIFREQAPKHLDSLRAAIAQQDAKTVETSAHSLKGELGYLKLFRRCTEWPVNSKTPVTTAIWKAPRPCFPNLKPASPCCSAPCIARSA